MPQIEQLSARSPWDLLMALARGVGDRERDQRRALFAFSIRVASAAIAYLSHALLARWMGAFEYGVFAYVWIWVIILGALSNLGLSTSVMRFVPQYRERGEADHLRGFVLRSLTISLAAPTAIAIAGAGVLYALQDVVTSYYVLPLFLAAICLPMFGLVETQDGVARAFSWIDVALLPPYIVRPVLLLALMAAAVLADAEPDAVTALWAAIGANWLTAAGQFLLLRRRLSGAVEPGPRRYRIGHWLAVSLPFMFMDGFYLILSHTDVLILDLFRQPEDIAVYFAALKTTGLIAFVHFAVIAVVTPRISQQHAAGRRDELAALLRDASQWMFWPSLLTAAGVLALGWPLLWLFGAGFTYAYPVMFILAAGLMVRAAMGPADALLNMMGHQKLTMLNLLAATVLNVALNLLLIPLYGLYGAAAATALSVSIQAVMLLLLARRRLGLNPSVFGAGAV